MKIFYVGSCGRRPRRETKSIEVQVKELREVAEKLLGFNTEPKEKTNLEKAQDLVSQIKNDRANLHVRQATMGTTRFLKFHQTMKDSYYDETVRLVRALQNAGKAITALGYQLEPSDLV
jgi:hypothetical protein